MIGVLVGIGFCILNIIFARRPEHSPGERGVLSESHSDYKQLRIEYHHSIDESLSPPKH